MSNREIESLYWRLLRGRRFRFVKR